MVVKTEEQGPSLKRGSGGRSFDVGHESTTASGYRERPTPAASHRCGTWKPRHGPAGMTQPVGRPTARKAHTPWRDGTAKKRMAAAERQQESEGK